MLFEIEEPSFSHTRARKGNHKPIQQKHKTVEPKHKPIQQKHKPVEPKPIQQKGDVLHRKRMSAEDVGFAFVGSQLKDYVHNYPIGELFLRKFRSRNQEDTIVLDAIYPMITVYEAEDFFRHDIASQLSPYFLAELKRIVSKIPIGDGFAKELVFGGSGDLSNLMVSNIVSIFRLYCKLNTHTVGQLIHLIEKKKLPEVAEDDDFFPF